MSNETSRQLAGSTSHISLMGRPFGAPRIHMDEDASSAPPAPAAAAESAALPAGGGEISILQASRALHASRKPKEQSAEGADTATADHELSHEGNAAPDDDQATGETQEQDPAAKPPLPLPRSWAKEQLEHWKSLPRATQEFVTAQAAKDSEAVRKAQNETADKLKGLTAKEQAAEEARQRFEDRTKAALSVLEREQLRDFPDIKTMDDIRNLSVTDPLRYLQWEVHQKEMVAAHRAAQEAEGRATQEKQTQWTAFVQKENALAAEHIPELADKTKAADLTTKAAGLLSELGFSDEELGGFAKGEKVSIFDHRIQRLLFSALKYTSAKAAPKPAQNSLPPVQRPGITPPRGAANSERIQALDKSLTASGSLKAAQELRAAQISGRRRAN